jgi:hypothetical protein
MKCFLNSTVLVFTFLLFFVDKGFSTSFEQECVYGPIRFNSDVREFLESLEGGGWTVAIHYADAGLKSSESPELLTNIPIRYAYEGCVRHTGKMYSKKNFNSNKEPVYCPLRGHKGQLSFMKIQWMGNKIQEIEVQFADRVDATFTKGVEEAFKIYGPPHQKSTREVEAFSHHISLWKLPKCRLELDLAEINGKRIPIAVRMKASYTSKKKGNP